MNELKQGRLVNKMVSIKHKKIFICFYLVFSIQDLNAQVIEGQLLANWKVDTLQGSTQYNNTYNEVWGLYVNGSEYAVIGSTAGTHFINVDDPENPREDFFIEGSSYGPHIIHRDYHDHNGYLYIVADEDIGTLKSRITSLKSGSSSILDGLGRENSVRKSFVIWVRSGCQSLTFSEDARLLYFPLCKGNQTAS